MTIAITGVNGFIGRELVRQLDSKDMKLRKLSHKISNQAVTQVNFQSLTEIESALKKSDVLIHCAWEGSVRSSRNNKVVQQRNLDIANNLIKVIPNTNIRKVLILGSQEEFGDTSRILKDDSVEKPETYYGKTKVRIRDNFSQLQQVTLIWCRLFSVYGPADSRDWIFTQALRAIKSGQKKEFGLCNLPWSFTHVRDVSNGLIKALELNENSTLNVSDLYAQPLRDSLLLLQEIAGKDQLFQFIDNNFESKQLMREPGIIDKIGWECNVTLQNGFKDVLEKLNDL
jgi:UDP-glucose 4-epimerase